MYFLDKIRESPPPPPPPPGLPPPWFFFFFLFLYTATLTWCLVLCCCFMVLCWFLIFLTLGWFHSPNLGCYFLYCSLFFLFFCLLACKIICPVLTCRNVKNFSYQAPLFLKPLALTRPMRHNLAVWHTCYL